MSIEIQCGNASCRVFGVVPDEAEGKKAKCQSCGQVFDVPARAKTPLDGVYLMTYPPFVSSGLALLGFLVLIAGLIGLALVMFQDVTVAAEGLRGERVANVALMDARRNWLLVSLFASGAGLAMGGRSRGSCARRAGRPEAQAAKDAADRPGEEEAEAGAGVRGAVVCDTSPLR